MKLIANLHEEGFLIYIYLFILPWIVACHLFYRFVLSLFKHKTEKNIVAVTSISWIVLWFIPILAEHVR